MAKFDGQLHALQLMEKRYKKLGYSAEDIAKHMTKVAAKYAANQVRSNAPSELKSHVKVSKSYKTPSDGGINTKVYVSGYIPFSDPNRKVFVRRGKAGGKKYATSKGVPAEFLALVTEYGTSRRYTDAGAYRGAIRKQPFFRKSFNKTQLESVMRRAQDEEFRRLGLDE